jgi:peroxiredoxin
MSLCSAPDSSGPFQPQRFANNRITFPLLSDVGSRIIDAYQIRDKRVKDGVSLHATFIINQKGVVRAKLFQVTASDRLSMR